MMERDETLRHRAQALMVQGMTKEDSAVAVHLAWLIRSIDQFVFPVWPSLVKCLARAHPEGFIAGYDDNSRLPEEYLVFVLGIHHEFRESCFETPFVRGYGPDQQPIPTLLERLTSVAIHEVRHRLQTKLAGDLRMWTPRHRGTGLMKAILDRVREAQLADILQAKIQSEKLLKGRLKEFDAQVVEYYALHHLHEVQDPSELAELVWLEP